MKISLKGCLLAVLFVCILPCGLLLALGIYRQQEIQASVDGDEEITLEVDGRQRTFYLHIPDNLNTNEPVPLVIMMHGGGGNAANAAHMSGFSAVADEEGFMVDYPNGNSRRDRDSLLTWNSGNCCGYAGEADIDDVAFIEALIDHTIENYNADPARVYATGMSNGAMMSFKVACELADKVAAIGPVVGAHNVEVCEPVEPVGLIMINGTDDEHVLYQGGPPEKSIDPHPRVDNPVQYAIDFWTAHNECNNASRSRRTDDIERTIYDDCAGGVQVQLITVHGGGHAWPGGERGSIFGDRPTDQLDASEAIWDFFSQHSKSNAAE